MNFSGALVALRTGFEVARESWSDRALRIGISRKASDGSNVDAWIYSVGPNNVRTFWVVGQSDVLAEDWVVINITSGP